MKLQRHELQKKQLENELLINALQRDKLIAHKRKLDEIDLPFSQILKKPKLSSITQTQSTLTSYFVASTKRGSSRPSTPKSGAQTPRAIEILSTKELDPTTNSASPLILTNKSEPSPIIHVTWSKEVKSRALDMLKRGLSVNSTHHLLARKIPRSTLQDWKSNQQLHRKKGSGHRLVCPELDEELFEWFLSQRSWGIRISDSLIQGQALELKEKYLKTSLIEGDEDQHEDLLKLSFTRGWLEKFKRRWKILSRVKTSKKLYSYEVLKKSVEDFYDELDFENLRHKFSCYYNMDETAVFFDPEGNETLEVKGAKSVPLLSHSDAKKRCTVILTVSSSGEKLPPIILMKIPKPKRYKRGDRPELDIYEFTRYRTQKLVSEKKVMVLKSYTAWNNSYYMSKYFVAHFFTHAQDPENGLLLMDNFGAHFTKEVDDKFQKKNIRTLGLAPNCTSCLQPLDVSINAPFKSNVRAAYRAWLVKQIKELDSNAGKKVPQPTDEDIVEWIIDAWDRVKSDSVRKSKESYRNIIIQVVSIGFDFTGITDKAARAHRIEKDLRNISLEADTPLENLQNEDFVHIEEVTDDPQYEELI
jgi:hypothetical protein